MSGKGNTNPNYPSTTGKPSGGGRGNTPKGKQALNPQGIYVMWIPYEDQELRKSTIRKGDNMSEKKITPQDNAANMQNANKGTKGTNKQYAQNQGNRGKQLNPNQARKSK